MPITLARSVLAFVALGLLASCSDHVEVDERTGKVESAWTEYSGTPTFAAGWQLRQVFEGNKDVWSPTRAGAFVGAASGWTYAFPKLENGAILGVTAGSNAPTQVDLTTKLLGQFVGGATTSRGPAMLYDRYYWQSFGGGGWVADAIRLSRLGPGGWTSELVDDQFSPNLLTGLCLVNRGGSLAALYSLGYQVLKLAEERAAGGWDVKALGGNDMMGAGPHGCAGGTQDLWFVLGKDFYDPPRVVRHRTGDVAAAEVIPLLPIGPRLRAASVAVGPDDVPMVAYIDDSTLRLATRTPDNAWNIEVVPTPFRADEVKRQDMHLSLVSGSPVLALSRYGYHPTASGVGKDEIWLFRQVDGAWRATQVYSPPGGWLRINGVDIKGDHVALGVAHSKYAGPYRNVIVEGPLP